MFLGLQEPKNYRRRKLLLSNCASNFPTTFTLNWVKRDGCKIFPLMKLLALYRFFNSNKVYAHELDLYTNIIVCITSIQLPPASQTSTCIPCILCTSYNARNAWLLNQSNYGSQQGNSCLVTVKESLSFISDFGWFCLSLPGSLLWYKDQSEAANCQRNAGS